MPYAMAIITAAIVSTAIVRRFRLVGLAVAALASGVVIWLTTPSLLLTLVFLVATLIGCTIPLDIGRLAAIAVFAFGTAILTLSPGLGLVLWAIACLMMQVDFEEP